MENKERLTGEMVAEILRLYPDHLSGEIAERVGVPIYKVYGVAYRHGLRKSEAFLASPASGRMQRGVPFSAATQFKKGHTPPTMGVRDGAHIKTATAKERWRATLFAKGHKPYNEAYDGAIIERRQIVGSRLFRYKVIRMAPRKWQYYQRYVWEQAHGAIPAGHKIVFKDGDRLNCALDNLECVSTGELCKRNSLHRYPAEIKELFRLRGKLKKEINQLNNKQL